MAVFGTAFKPVVAAVKSEIRFEPPRYLVREALDYSTFTRCIRVLRDSGFATSSLARGLGVRLADIERAEKIARRT